MTYLLWSLLFTHLTIACVSLYLHRSLAHSSVTFHPWVAHVMRLYLWLTTGIVSTTWVAIHRKHHAFTDTERDPHSPQQLGILRVLLGGTWLYLKHGRDAHLMQAYGRGCPRDTIERRLYQPYPYLGLPIGLTLYCLAFGWVGVLMFVVNFLWIPFWAAGVVNGLGHWIGYRPYDTRDSSRNFFPIGLLMVGEELHNNHHNYPASAKLSRKWYEFDLGWVWIRTLSLLGLATIHRV